MMVDFLTTSLGLALAKITVLLAVALVVSCLLKKPEARANLWFCTIVALPFVVALSFSEPLLKVIPNASVQAQHAPEIAAEAVSLSKDGELTKRSVSEKSSSSANNTPQVAQAAQGMQSGSNSVKESAASSAKTVSDSPRMVAEASEAVSSSAVAGGQYAWVKVVYLTGFLVSLLPLTLSVLRMLFIKKQRASGSLLEMWKSIRAKQSHQLYVADSSVGPCALGVLFPKVLISEEGKAWDERRLQSALSHEAAHLQRRDPATRLVSTLIKAALWFHPLVWLAHIKLIQAQEESCDQLALATGVEPEDYADDLLFAASSSHAGPIEAIAMARWSQLGKRINHILTKGKEPPTTMKTQLTIIALTAGASFALATTGTTNTASSSQGVAEGVFVKKIEGVTEADFGKGLSFDFNKLPAHEALEISFTAHIIGPWDGSGLAKYGPDRLICEIDGSTRLLDATFNNCFLVYKGNIWQSYPDPHHAQQYNYDKAESFLHHGGENASAVSTKGIKHSFHNSVDSSYQFKFLVRHSGDMAKLKFSTEWVEDTRETTYWIEDIQVKTIAKVPELSAEAEEQAWNALFGGDAAAVHQAWSTVYMIHPEKLMARAKVLADSDLNHLKNLCADVAAGETPAASLSRDVVVSASNPDAANTQKRILKLRELHLMKQIWIKDDKKFWNSGVKELSAPIRLFFGNNGKNGATTTRARMRIASYLRMLKTEESEDLASKFDKYLSN